MDTYTEHWLNVSVQRETWTDPEPRITWAVIATYVYEPLNLTVYHKHFKTERAATRHKRRLNRGVGAETFIRHHYNKEGLLARIGEVALKKSLGRYMRFYNRQPDRKYYYAC